MPELRRAEQRRGLVQEARLQGAVQRAAGAAVADPEAQRVERDAEPRAGGVGQLGPGVGERVGGGEARADVRMVGAAGPAHRLDDAAQRGGDGGARVGQAGRAHAERQQAVVGGLRPGLRRARGGEGVEAAALGLGEAAVGDPRDAARRGRRS